MDALPLCRRWLQQCCTSHQRCEPEMALHSVPPTRLLEIGRNGPRIRLAEEIARGTLPVRYATLSHCWGTTDFTTLTLTNIDSFRKQIPSNVLTKTFLDAIQIARYLGFTYLWIDSLCIIQDSTEDWARESGLMTNVYGGSSLTIAASSSDTSSAESGTVGCFFGRSRDWHCQVRQSNSTVLWDVYSKAPWQNVRLEPDLLTTRAWVLQERYLSRRTLHFTEQQVFWECHGNPACELFPRGYPAAIRLEFKLAFALWKRRLTRRQWPAIVEDYSRRQLTKFSDKFPALGGLARLIQDESKDEYIAGMWRERLEYQLTWTVHSPDNNRGWTEPYIAPSWSWASATGGICLSQ